jgi:hypothetical protein
MQKKTGRQNESRALIVQLETQTQLNKRLMKLIGSVTISTPCNRTLGKLHEAIEARLSGTENEIAGVLATQQQERQDIIAADRRLTRELEGTKGAIHKLNAELTNLGSPHFQVLNAKPGKFGKFLQEMNESESQSGRDQGSSPKADRFRLSDGLRNSVFPI